MFYDDRNDVNHKRERQSMYLTCSNTIAKQNQETARFIKNFAPKEEKETNMKCLRNSSEVE